MVTRAHNPLVSQAGAQVKHLVEDQRCVQAGNLHLIQVDSLSVGLRETLLVNQVVNRAQNLPVSRVGTQLIHLVEGQR